MMSRTIRVSQGVLFLTCMVFVLIPGCDSEQAKEGPPAATTESDDGSLSTRESELLDQIDRATLALDRLWKPGPNGEAPPDGFFREYHLRYEVFALGLHSGLEGYFTNDSTGPTVDETIAACEKAGAKGWAEMLRAGREVLFDGVAPTGEAYDAWLKDNFILSDEANAELSEIESKILYADPSRAEEMPLLQIAAAIEAGIEEAEAAIEDQELFNKWVKEEKARFDKGVSLPATGNAN